MTLSEESTSFIVGSLLDAISLMHKHKILHRDIKPENVVLVHVLLLSFREMLNSVTSAGLSTKRNNYDQLSAERLYTCHLNS
jgi:serine/threonine protein kinase